MRRLFTVSEMKGRKCPLTRLRCLGGSCALWADEGLKQVYHKHYSGLQPVGFCTLGHNR